jgi:hypothetical protein
MMLPQGGRIVQSLIITTLAETRHQHGLTLGQSSRRRPKPAMALSKPPA